MAIAEIDKYLQKTKNADFLRWQNACWDLLTNPEHVHGRPFSTAPIGLIIAKQKLAEPMASRSLGVPDVVTSSLGISRRFRLFVRNPDFRETARSQSVSQLSLQVV